MNDWAKYLIGIGAGYAAALIYKNYQAEQSMEAARLARSRRSTAGKLTDLAVQGARDVGLVPAGQMQGMAGHMPMSQAQAGGFYGQGGMRQSAPGNPHAPVVVPRRQAPQAPPPPPPAAAAAAAAEGESEGEAFESYSDDNMMGGQRF